MREKRKRREEERERWGRERERGEERLTKACIDWYDEHHSSLVSIHYKDYSSFNLKWKIENRE
jgi:hypothetical protein